MRDLSVTEARSLLSAAGKGAGLSWGVSKELTAAVLLQGGFEAYCEQLEAGSIDVLNALVSDCDLALIKGCASPETIATLPDVLLAMALGTPGSTPGSTPGGAAGRTAKSGPNRVLISESLYHRFYRLMLKTTVPHTEESRLGGAGAGTSDND